MLRIPLVDIKTVLKPLKNVWRIWPVQDQALSINPGRSGGGRMFSITIYFYLHVVGEVFGGNLRNTNCLVLMLFYLFH